MLLQNSFLTIEFTVSIPDDRGTKKNDVTGANLSIAFVYPT